MVQVMGRCGSGVCHKRRHKKKSGGSRASATGDEPRKLCGFDFLIAKNEDARVGMALRAVRSGFFLTGLQDQRGWEGSIFTTEHTEHTEEDCRAGAMTSPCGAVFLTAKERKERKSILEGRGPPRPGMNALRQAQDKRMGRGRFYLSAVALAKEEPLINTNHLPVDAVFSPRFPTSGTQILFILRIWIKSLKPSSFRFS